jgi:hypothetical protein
MHHRIKSALDQKDEETFLSLVQNRYEIGAASKNGVNALTHCIMTYNLKMLECVINHTDVDLNSLYCKPNSNHETLKRPQPGINIALFMKKKSMVKLLLNAGASTEHKETFPLAFQELKDISVVENIVSKADIKQLEQYKKFIEKMPDNDLKNKTSKIIQNYELRFDMEDKPKQKTIKI